MELRQSVLQEVLRITFSIGHDSVVTNKAACSEKVSQNSVSNDYSQNYKNKRNHFIFPLSPRNFPLRKPHAVARLALWTK